MLADIVKQKIEITTEITSRDTLLELLYSHAIEPQLQHALFIFNYPASQAALARITSDEAGYPVALRFELVISGMEIANGYDELADAQEQSARFASDHSVRKQHAQSLYPADQRLLAALAHGLPACAGVALGVDRLLMLQTGTTDIRQVLTFPHERA
jgi:lysyl-tRNA synthetase class 2